MTQARTQVDELQPTEDTVVAAPVGAVADRTTTTDFDPHEGRRAGATKLVQAVYLAVGVIEALLFIRLALRLLGANAEAGFAQAIYWITNPLVSPFVGLFAPQAVGGAMLELDTLIALVAYAVAGWVVARVAWLLFGDDRSSRVAHSNSVHTRLR